MGRGASFARRAAVAASLLGAVLAALLLGGPAAAEQARTLHGAVHVSKKGNGTGTVKSRPPVDNIETGINCGPQCVASFTDTTDAKYKPVTLTAIPDPGSFFKGWSGDCAPVDQPTCTMPPIGRLVNYFVTATFDQTPPENYPVAVATDGEGTVRSEPPGIDCGTACAAPFKTGSTATLTATPAAGWTFKGWGGACKGVGTCALTIDGPKSVEATFAPPSFRLTVATAGTGSVGSAPAGIACGSACTATFPSGGTVTLTASPGQGASFVSWGGACGGAGTTCAVTISEARAVTAVFSGASRQPLAVATSGTGSVTSAPSGISCGATCGATFAPGTTVTLTATPAAGWRLTAWGGACTGSARTCAVTMGAARAVIATFARAPRSYPLAVTVGGTGVVTSTPAGIRCRPTCTSSMATGVRVTLVAKAAAKWTFVRWSGACTGRTPTCIVTMAAPRTVTASFARNADQQPPKVTALASSGVRGSVVRLRYRVTDDSGKSREWATVYRGSASIAVVRGRLDEADPEALFYFLPWKAPSSLSSGALRFCVQAADPTGNTSKASCSKVRLT